MHATNLTSEELSSLLEPTHPAYHPLCLSQPTLSRPFAGDRHVPYRGSQNQVTSNFDAAEAFSEHLSKERESRSSLKGAVLFDSQYNS